MPLKINFKTILLYAVYSAATVFLNFAMPQAPLSFGLFFAMLLCGTNIAATPILYLLGSLTATDITVTALCAAQALFITVIVFLYRRSGRKLKWETTLYAAIALAPYVVFGKWSGFGEATGLDPYLLKGIAAAASGAFTYFCFKGLYAVLFRLYRCRLREDEWVCIAVVCAAAGYGFYAVAGEGIYLCLAAALIGYFTRLMRSPSSLLFALTLALPMAVSRYDLEPLTACVTISAAALITLGGGKFAPALFCTGLTAGYMYLRGCFECPVPMIVTYALLLFCAAALPSLPSDKKLKEMRMRLNCESVLDGAAVTRSRKRTGERLYRISELFREIECSFMALDENIDEGAMRERMLAELKNKLCVNCEKYKKCQKSAVYPGFRRLIDAGCIKGKVNLIDLPSEITAGCLRPSDAMKELNGILAEYRRFMAESENAHSGRRLLADQARGISEVLKDLAVELNRAAGEFSDSERAVKEAFSAGGISCPEVQIDGLYGEICVAACGKFSIGAIEKVLNKTLDRRFILKDKYALDSQKTCLVFSSPPKFDAAFGVASAIKKGEKASGDTHSVIKINEHAFLMALSDGMGSGEYAKRVSEAAISLIEAFYRAEMPEETVLKTINKLLSFNRDERFTCIDIAAVNLNTGRADFVKIGSPAGIIMRAGEIKVLESASLPLGILDNLKPTVCSEFLKSGDMVVFMSDGVSSAFPSSTELYEFLQGLKPLNPQSLADKILGGALDRSGHTATDDMTVLCTRIFDST